MGIVAKSAHQKGKTRSATRPAAMKVIQKTLRCMAYSSSELAPATRAGAKAFSQTIPDAP